MIRTITETINSNTNQFRPGCRPASPLFLQIPEECIDKKTGDVDLNKLFQVAFFGEKELTIKYQTRD